MTESVETRKEQARSADEEAIGRFLHDGSPEVIRALLDNCNLSEDDIRIIATRKNLPADILETIARDKRWLESYPVRLSLVWNPKTPLSLSLSIARHLRLFDLAEITRNHYLPLVLRRKIEFMIMEKIPALDLGIKKSLAKMASGEVLLKLMQNGYPDIVRLCLNNPYLVEAHLYKIINNLNTATAIINIIAEHPKWSSRPMIKFALVRNPHTSLALSTRFVREMKTTDIREIYTDPSTPVTIRPFIHRELLSRGEQPEAVQTEEIFAIDEEDETVIDRFNEGSGSND